MWEFCALSLHEKISLYWNRYKTEKGEKLEPIEEVTIEVRTSLFIIHDSSLGCGFRIFSQDVIPPGK